MVMSEIQYRKSCILNYDVVYNGELFDFFPQFTQKCLIFSVDGVQYRTLSSL